MATTAVVAASPLVSAALHSVCLWLLIFAGVALVLAGYFHSRALKCIDEAAPDVFVKNWQSRREMAEFLGVTWLPAAIAGLAGANVLGVMLVAMISGAAPIAARRLARSYEQHQDVRGLARKGR